MIRTHTHIGSYGIINANGQIVLIKKARGGYTGKLDLPGGGIEHNETPNEALNRELMEEVGATVTESTLLDVLSNNMVWHVRDELDEDLHHLGIIYLAKIKENTLKMDPDGLDSNGASWYDINSLDDQELTPFAKYAVDYLKKH